ncbi:MAG: copper-binding protein [Chloroflexi bacterium]|jgi:amicyanin|nr:copper-binding protein [Chloroflexota bacterium]
MTPAFDMRPAGRRRLRCAAATALVAWLATGPVVSVPTVEAAPAAPTSVQILKDSYAPPSITIKAGDSVTWSNADTTPGNGHTVTSSGRGPLKSPSMSQGGTFSYTFATAGTYAYYCAIHPDMTGTVIVQ